MIWAHGLSPTQIDSLAAICTRMEEDGDAPGLIISGGVSQRSHARSLGLQTIARLENNSRELLNDPRICLAIWTQASLHDLILADIQLHKLPIILIDAHFEGRGHDDFSGRWWRGGMKRKLASFDHIFTRDLTTKHRLIKIGATAEAMTVAGRLDEFAPPVAPKSGRIAEIIEDLNARPIWLAAYGQISDLSAIAAAHRQASLHAHRLLLIMHLEDEALKAKSRKVLNDAGIGVADWDDGEFPDEGQQALITADHDGIPDWLHLAPATYLGGSLEGAIREGPGLAPNRAAQMGSVLIHGPEVGSYGTSLRKLTKFGATFPIRSGSGLGTALERVLQPDIAAKKALAGWQALTEGAAAANLLMDYIRTSCEHDYA